MAAIARMALDVARISPKTCWSFIRLFAKDGRVGHGEATLQGREAAIAEAAARHASAALLSDLGQPERFADTAAPVTLEEAAAVSAIDQALWDLAAQGAGLPLARKLGGVRRSQVPVYANINRRTEDRSPAGFAASARAALACGHAAFKLAPFDEVSVARCAAGEGEADMRAGLARVAAVREVVGAGARLMIDCHWRFDEATAGALIDATRELQLHWIECPLPETAETIPALRRLRARANAQGVRLAGLEQAIGRAGFQPYCEAGAYDVMMPDIKYVGGYAEMLRVADLFGRHGVAMSPHNPSGPISHAASLHVAAALADFDALEMQFDESPLFDSLLDDPLPAPRAGSIRQRDTPGLGASLSQARLASLAAVPARVWECR
ncbi:MAG: mandelate racemase/muconate lactonizing enzyme family protein [Burkholderiales bacterium]|nr:mandelate racemase/muconate lactonizing enzyme family protein [Burkholderiales bacterium]